MDAQAYLAERGRLVDEALARWLPDVSTPPATLHAAMRHLVFPGGKRLRPALAFAGAEAVGAPPERALEIAAAVELVHTYSLVHDDLPCMDDDDERRGRPTVHRLYGEATAVLAGDALLAAAFELLAQAAGREAPGPPEHDAGREAPGPPEHEVWRHEPARVAAALRDLAHAAGSQQLVAGQVEDLSFAREEATPDGVEAVHRRKTGALFVAAVVGGARLGGGDGAQLADLRVFAEAVGVAFQIADDGLDSDRDEACSLARLLGADAARARADALLQQGLAALESFGAPAEALRELARFAVWRDR